MIRALEAHVAAWVGREISRLADECGLFAGISAAAGEPGPAADSTDGVAVHAWVTGMLPEPAREGIGTRAVTEGQALHMQARLALRVAGPARELDAAAGREFIPAAAGTYQVDLIALTLLALLQEQAIPTPDGAASAPPEPAGSASASQGARRVELAWRTLAVGEPVLSTVNGVRRWEIPLSAPCTFRLSPAPREGGQIRQMQAEQTVAQSDRRDTLRLGG